VKEAVLAWLSRRGPLVLLATVLTLAVALFRGPCPDNDAAALALALGEATKGVVSAKDIRWEPSRGALSDLILGRFVLVLSSPSAGGPRDVWRVRVRVTPEGHPLAVVDAHDLTQTPLGDDHALVVRGDHAAFATFAYGQEQSATALDLSGEGAQSSASTTLERITAAITNVQQTGTSEGIGRVDVGFDAPGERIGLALQDASLAIDLGDSAGERHAVLDLDRGELQATPSGMHAEAARHLPKRFVFWAVDTVRAVPWIGPGPIAWLEEKVFALRDTLKQATFKREGTRDELADAPPLVLDDATLTDDGGWPLPNVPSIWKSTEPGEGAWKPYAPQWLRKTEGAPPAFMTTFVRPDDARPYSHVLLVAMDTRQLDLDMEAGTEDPKPLTGQHGPGRLPRDPAVLTRVVAAFNGAFKTEHGTYGMMVHKRVLLPAQPNAATVIVLKDGRSGFGNWGAVPSVMGFRGVRDDEIMSFRQNLDALVDGGEVNPTKRLLWGYTLPGSGMQTERSGLCVTKAGHLIYAWGDDTSATALGKAMRAAGCDYGMHLDMNPHHTGFLFTTIREIKGHNYRSEALTPLMEMSTDRYIEYAAKDFFYMMVRDPLPPKVEGAASWTADEGTQPSPAWSPGIWTTTVSGAGAPMGGEVTLVSIDGGRARYRMAAGTAEPDSKTGSQPAFEIDDDSKKRVVMSVELGVAFDRHPRGLVIAGKHVLGMEDSASEGVLAQKDGTLSITTADDPALGKPGVDATELPLVLQNGAVTQRGELTLSRKTTGTHAALCVQGDGRVVIARGEVSSAKPLAVALKAAGCSSAVLLDRGEGATANVRRSGTGNPPVARSGATELFVLGESMRARSFRF
jgi:hypothetical protein